MVARTVKATDLPRIFDMVSRNVQKNTKKTKINASRKGAQFMVKAARRLAPKREGRLRKGIKWKANGDKAEVTSVAISPETQFSYPSYVDNQVKVNKTYYYKSRRGGGGYSGMKGEGYFTKAKKMTNKFLKKKVRTIIRNDWSLLTNI